MAAAGIGPHAAEKFLLMAPLQKNLGSICRKEICGEGTVEFPRCLMSLKNGTLLKNLACGVNESDSAGHPSQSSGEHVLSAQKIIVYPSAKAASPIKNAAIQPIVLLTCPLAALPMIFLFPAINTISTMSGGARMPFTMAVK